MNWNGPAHRGAMRLHRARKRAEAEQRNHDAQPVQRYDCGHRHSDIQHQLCNIRRGIEVTR